MSTSVHNRPVRKVFTNRLGGVSQPPYSSFNLGDHVGDDPASVAANRKRLASVIGLPETSLVWMEQIHSNTVTVVDEANKNSGVIPATDAIIATKRGLALCVLVADCVPVLISDTEAGVIAAVHAGRLGARNGIVAKTVEAMTTLGAHPRNMHVLMGGCGLGEKLRGAHADGGRR